MSLALGPVEPRARAFELVRRHGHDTVSFQGLETGYRYFFDGDDALVAFVDTGGAWVAAGGPVAPPARVVQVAHHFAEAAMAQRRRACFFAAEQALVEAGLPALRIGEQPVWSAARWDEVLAGSSSLRYQLRRARHKQVAIRRLASDELAPGTRLRAQIDELGRHWQRTHRMPPMRFLVQLEPLTFASERMLYLAERGGVPVGLASAVPVYARRRMFVEDLVRAPDAPNGTIELLVDAVMRAVVAFGLHEVTLGLAPLAGDVARWLRFARWAGSSLYDFDGLRRFKAKLRPHAWEPIYLCAQPGGSRMIALRDSLRAFAGGSLVGFATRTIFRRSRE
ncbi:MAG: phosphatidylglycerol lysyltransferase domain-containing protein [Acidobacteriota bacterium]